MANKKLLIVIGVILAITVIVLLILWLTGVFSSSSTSSGGGGSPPSSGGGGSPPSGGGGSPPSSGGTNNWAPVMNRPSGLSDMDWSAQIYDSMEGNPIGTSKPPYQGGIGYNAQFIKGIDTLDQQTATKLCGNPCYWFYNLKGQPRPSNDPNVVKMTNAGLCQCGNSTNGISTSAINF